MTSEIIRLGQGLTVSFYLDAAQTDGQFTFFKVTIEPGAKVPAAHYHENFDETIFVLKGQLSLQVDDELLLLNAGECKFISRGRIHSFKNESDSVVEVTAYANPGVLTANYFKDLLDVLKQGGPELPVEVKAVMNRYGLMPVAS